MIDVASKVDVVVESDAATAWATTRLLSAEMMLSEIVRSPAMVAWIKFSPAAVLESVPIDEVMAAEFDWSFATTKAVFDAVTVLNTLNAETARVGARSSSSTVEIVVPVRAKVFATPLPDASDVIALLLADRLVLSTVPVPVAILATRSVKPVPATSIVEVTPVALVCVDPKTAMLVPPSWFPGVAESLTEVVKDRLPKSSDIALVAVLALAVDAIELLSTDTVASVKVEVAVVPLGLTVAKTEASAMVDEIASPVFGVVVYCLFSSDSWAFAVSVPVVNPAVYPSRLSTVRIASGSAVTTVSIAVRLVALAVKLFVAVLPTAVDDVALESAAIVTFSIAVARPSAVTVKPRDVPSRDDRTPPFKVCSPTTAAEAVKSFAVTVSACVATLALAVPVTALLDNSIELSVIALEVLPTARLIE